jgi:hypothetical protein
MDSEYLVDRTHQKVAMGCGIEGILTLYGMSKVARSGPWFQEPLLMLPGSPAAMVDTPSRILGCLADKAVHVSIGPVNVKHFSADAFLPDLLAEFKWEL